MGLGASDSVPTDREIAYEHFEKIRSDIRDEIKQRIKQRDQYSTRLTIVLGTLAGLAFASGQVAPYGQLHRILLAASLVSIYYTVLILYSYRVHKIAATYLRKKIEPELAHICHTDVSKEWETYYKNLAIPGIRKGFFIAELWVVTVGSPLLVFYLEGWKINEFSSLLGIMTAIYMAISFVINVVFWKR